MTTKETTKKNKEMGIVAGNEQLGVTLFNEVSTKLTNFPKEDLTYDFSRGGKQVFGISWKGIREVNNLLYMLPESPYKIIIESVEVVENVKRGDREGIKAVARARNTANGQQGFGISFVFYEQMGRTGKFETVSPEKTCASIAKRNAILDILPSLVVDEFLRRFMGNGEVQIDNHREVIQPDDTNLGARREKVIKGWSAMIEKCENTEDVYHIQVKITAKETNLLSSNEEKYLVAECRQKYTQLAQQERADGKEPFIPSRK